MKYIIPFLFIALLVASCQEAENTEEVQTDHEVHGIEPAQETVADVHQTNVVTPEFWSSFDTDVTIVFYYSKIESSPEEVHGFKQQLINGADAHGYDFHEYHTDENMGMVQVDDNIFFNLTEYLWANDEGFVLLKKGDLVHIPSTELSEGTFEEKVVLFFQ